MSNYHDVIIIGAGAAGLMCAIEAGKRGRKVVVLDHANKPGKKILMSGGGRCNFTNYHLEPKLASKYFISANPDFCKSALMRYTPQNFIKLVKKHRIPFHEKAHGQLFCDNKSKDIVEMLLAECALYKVTIMLNTTISQLKKSTSAEAYPFILTSAAGQEYRATSLVIASGGLSIPTLGASPFGYKIAEQFGLKIIPTRAGLVPLTLHQHDKERLAPLVGVAADCSITSVRQEFTESMLFTHRGLSGPAFLQISSYWQPGEVLVLNFFSKVNLLETLQAAHRAGSQVLVKNFMSKMLPKSLVAVLLPSELAAQALNKLTQEQLQKVTQLFSAWDIKPNATEGYRTAEVTLGGVACDQISSKTMEVNSVPGLYFIGEVLDVSGWLGGFNFQWAWSSGWAAGQVV